MKSRNIRVLGLVCLLVLVLALPASAQDYPKAEIFGGFSFAIVDDPIDFEREAFLGFQTRFAGNLNKSFGIVGDFGGHYRALDLGGRAYEFMVGPRFTSSSSSERMAATRPLSAKVSTKASLAKTSSFFWESPVAFRSPTRPSLPTSAARRLGRPLPVAAGAGAGRAGFSLCDRHRQPPHL